MVREEVLQKLKSENVKYLRLQFVDLLGVSKNVEVPENQFTKALDGEIMFDGSSIYGFSRIEESDMLLKPDLGSLKIFPWIENGHKTASLICDIYTTENQPYKGCPRLALKRIVKEAKDLGFDMYVGPEPEFYIFKKDSSGNIIMDNHDNAGYFDLSTLDNGDFLRKEITIALQEMGFEIEASHHECGPGQHEIDFKYDDAIKTADNIALFTFVVRKIAKDNGLHATFMPKPVHGIAGSGMHLNQSLFKNGKNAFFDDKKEYQLSELAKNYIAGILRHAKGITAVTNPLVNSYKRLLPGFEAPINIAWSLKNRSPLIRIPGKRGESTRIELRVPDPAANPYLAIAVSLKAGLEGIKQNLTPPEMVKGNIFEMSDSEKEKHKIEQLPSNLFEAISELKKDDILKDALGSHIFKHYCNAKLMEWNEYSSKVHQWELDCYINHY
ncbi:MAG: type I glutamate--ammonia ligase [Candidatus Delongbacteria bacterium]|nr:type I glutamate--ammonia ligase [Candidatus Delongbacteria bacterium]MBN2833517.1 type I glutamate--ammonia ligase [Candidatus Delongbacteria bacterium]